MYKALTPGDPNPGVSGLKMMKHTPVMVCFPLLLFWYIAAGRFFTLPLLRLLQKPYQFFQAGKPIHLVRARIFQHNAPGMVFLSAYLPQAQ